MNFVNGIRVWLAKYADYTPDKDGYIRLRTQKGTCGECGRTFYVQGVPGNRDGVTGPCCVDWVTVGTTAGPEFTFKTSN